MNKYYLGDLRDWGSALNKLEMIKNNGMLDSAQDELVRILRYKKNWKLVEAVLESAVDLIRPSNTLIEEVFNTATDYQTCIDTRIMAVNSLCTLLITMMGSKDEEAMKKKQLLLYITMMSQMLNTPQPPIFYDAISRLLFKLKEF